MIAGGPRDFPPHHTLIPAGTPVTQRVPPASTNSEPGYTLASLHFAVEQLLNWPLNGPLMEALRRAGTASFMDLLSLTDQDLLQLQCSVPVFDANGNDTGTTQLGTLPRPYRGSIRALFGFAHYRQHELEDPITPVNCMQIDQDTFERYRCSANFIVFNNSIAPQTILNRSSSLSPSQDSSMGRDFGTLPPALDEVHLELDKAQPDDGSPTNGTQLPIDGDTVHVTDNLHVGSSGSDAKHPILGPNMGRGWCTRSPQLVDGKPAKANTQSDDNKPP